MPISDPAFDIITQFNEFGFNDICNYFRESDLVNVDGDTHFPYMTKLPPGFGKSLALNGPPNENPRKNATG